MYLLGHFPSENLGVSFCYGQKNKIGGKGNEQHSIKSRGAERQQHTWFLQTRNMRNFIMRNWIRRGIRTVSQGFDLYSRYIGGYKEPFQPDL